MNISTTHLAICFINRESHRPYCDIYFCVSLQTGPLIVENKCDAHIDTAIVFLQNQMTLCQEGTQTALYTMPDKVSTRAHAHTFKHTEYLPLPTPALKPINRTSRGLRGVWDGEKVSERLRANSLLIEPNQLQSHHKQFTFSSFVRNCSDSKEKCTNGFVFPLAATWTSVQTSPYIRHDWTTYSFGHLNDSWRHNGSVCFRLSYHAFTEWEISFRRINSFIFRKSTLLLQI